LADTFVILKMNCTSCARPRMCADGQHWPIHLAANINPVALSFYTILIAVFGFKVINNSESYAVKMYCTANKRCI
jgi:hypothetical protein